MTAAELIAELQKVPPETLVTATDHSCCGCNTGPAIFNFDGETVFIDGDSYAG